MERSSLAFVWGGVRPASPRNNLRGGAQRQSDALNAVLLAALLVLATASGANAQTIVGPGTIGSTVDVNLSNSPVTVVGNTIITVPGGDGIDAPSYNEPGGHLTIDTESALAPPGPISITSGGTGVASIFPSSPATISISSGPHGDVTIMSGGAALGVSGDESLTASNANGGTLTFQSTGAFGVVAQFGAKVDITGATDIANSGVGAVLIGGDLTDEGAIGNLTNVDISTTDAVGLDATRMGTIATMTNGSITVTGAGLAALYSDTDGVTNVTNVKITTTGDIYTAPLPKQPTRSAFRYLLAAERSTSPAARLRRKARAPSASSPKASPRFPRSSRSTTQCSPPPVAAPWVTAPTAPPPSAPRIPPP